MSNSYDVIEDTIGSLGRWQILLTVIHSFIRIPISWHQIGIVFLAAETNFTCISSAGKNETLSQCDSKCDSYEFDTSEFTSTIIMQWKLVCDRKNLLQIVQPLVMAGILFGSTIFGYFSDKFGRKIPLFFAIIMETLTGCVAAFVPWFWLFVTLKFLTSVAIGGIVLLTFVIVMEFIGKIHRTLIGVLIHVPFHCGYGFLGLLGYLIRDWQYFQFTISIISIVFLPLYWIVPESPRWLLLVDRSEESIDILTKAAKRNKLPTSTISNKINNHMASLKNIEHKAGNLIDLVKTKEMRKRTICLDFITFFIFLVYFGASQYLGQIGNAFVNVGISGMIQVPGAIFSYLSLTKLGRKWTIIGASALCSIIFLLLLVVPDDSDWGTTILGALGILFNSMTVTTIYTYSGELYPTVIRSLGMGTSAMFGKLGSTIAPFVIIPFNGLDWLPPVILGICAFMPALFCIKLPETLNQKLPDTIEEAEQIGQEEKSSIK